MNIVDCDSGQILGKVDRPIQCDEKRVKKNPGVTAHEEEFLNSLADKLKAKLNLMDETE